MRRFNPYLLGLLLFNAIGAYASTATAVHPLQSLAPMLDNVMPAIVNVRVQGELPASVTTTGKKSHGGARKFETLGSGVILEPTKGYILTNAHVVKDAKVITITLNDGRRIKAKMIGADPLTDIAVIQIKAPSLKTLPIANSDQVKVGDFTVAIGNPFGLARLGGSKTATFGIVSALHRSDVNPGTLESFIQTDAAINPGNSGGALIDVKGQLIGINTGIISPSGGNIGIGFAIPINMARSVMEQLIKYGSVHRGLMGIFVQELTPELADAFGISGQNGALVTQVNANSPAARAGLKAADIIQSINNATVRDAAQVKNTISLLRVGSNITMRILRDGTPMTISAKVADVKHHEEQQLKQNPFLYGLAIRNFDQQVPLHDHVRGAQIMGATEVSPGWRAGLRPGDVIIRANKKPVRNIADLNRIARESKEQLLTHVLRGAGSLFIVIR